MMRRLQLWLPVVFLAALLATASTALAQDPPAVPADVPGLLAALIAIVAPAIAGFLAMQVAKVNAKIADAPAILKLVLVTIIGYVLATVQQFTGLVQLPTSLEGLDAFVLEGIINTAGAILLHRFWKSTEG